MKDLRCLKFYQHDLALYSKEVKLIGRLRNLGLFIGVPLMLLGVVSVFIPNLPHIDLNNYFKLAPILSGAFFSSVGLINKGDLRYSKQKIDDLTVNIEYYSGYDSMEADVQKKIDAECEKLIAKRIER